MDFSELNQIKLYELNEDIKQLKLKIDEEQYSNTCLHQRRSMLNVSIIKNIIILLYFLALFLGVWFLRHLSDVWGTAKENPVIGKLLELSDAAATILLVCLLLAILVSLIFLVRKIFLIWLNSDSAAAITQAENTDMLPFNRQITLSDRRLATYYYELQQLEETVKELEETINSDSDKPLNERSI